jgi:hypothetical protein
MASLPATRTVPFPSLGLPVYLLAWHAQRQRLHRPDRVTGLADRITRERRAETGGAVHPSGRFSVTAAGDGHARYWDSRN